MADEACGEVLRDPCALTLGDEPLETCVEVFRNTSISTAEQKLANWFRPLRRYALN